MSCYNVNLWSHKLVQWKVINSNSSLCHIVLKWKKRYYKEMRMNNLYMNVKKLFFRINNIDRNTERVEINIPLASWCISYWDIHPLGPTFVVADLFYENSKSYNCVSKASHIKLSFQFKVNLPMNHKRMKVEWVNDYS